MPSKNHISRVTIVGAGGNSGRPIAEALLSTGIHTVTALTRPGSTSALPAGIATKTADYTSPASLAAALAGEDALIITMSAFAPPDTDDKLIDAAAAAGVPFVFPNEWAGDSTNEKALVEQGFGRKRAEKRERVERGGGAWVAVVTGQWYEWSLAMRVAYGFDFERRRVELFGDGEAKINTSTWPQIGRAVAALLSLPVEPEREGELTLGGLRNKHVYVSSFLVSQRDMLESVLRVTGTRMEEWTVESQGVEERWREGKEEFERGEMAGFAKMLYARVFFPDGHGNYEGRKGTLNEALGLPKEDIDEFTRIAIERSKTLEMNKM